MPALNRAAAAKARNTRPAALRCGGAIAGGTNVESVVVTTIRVPLREPQKQQSVRQNPFGG
jgi:hypothetical protein